jgi:hypothetical protein
VLNICVGEKMEMKPEYFTDVFTFLDKMKINQDGNTIEPLPIDF